VSSADRRCFAGVPVSRSETYPTSVDDFPSAPREAVRSLVDWARVAFAENLVSVVVHGSLAWGCWGPSSDIDILLVVEARVGLEEFHEMLVAGDARAPGNGFELSVLSRAAARSGSHPIDYLYHFSRGRLARESPQRWDLRAVKRDPDLAGHLKVAWTTGVCAFGPPVRQVLRRVSDEEFLDSVRADVLESCEEVLDLRTSALTPQADTPSLAALASSLPAAIGAPGFVS
jgi:predicted nucleotidyltransferase